MSGYRRYQPGDDAHVTDGDSGWLGVNMRLDPCQLPPGICAAAKNKRFRFGKASTRLGIVKLPYFARLGAPFPLVFPIDFEQPYPIGVNIHGAGTFDDPDDQKWQIIAADGLCFAAAQGFISFRVPLPAGIVLSGRVFFVQAVGKFFMFRGEDHSTLVMEDVNTGFTEITQENSGAGNGTGTLTIPNSSFALFFQNRLFVLYGRDEIAVSDALNMTRYSITNAFRINRGSADALTGIYAWNDTTVVVTKEHSIYAVSNLIPNSLGDFDQARLEVITRDWGIVAPKSMIAVGSDLIGLSQRGVVSIRQTETNKLQAVDLPLSDAIQPLINGINWKFAHLAVAAFWDNKYYLAIPSGNAEVEGQELLVDRVYGGDGQFPISNLVPTRTYRVVLRADAFVADGVTYDDELQDYPINADVTLLNGAVRFLGSEDDPVQASLKQVFKGVNNAVLVYDTLQSQWAGYDESQALMVQEFLLADYDDGERLHYIASDGWMNLYEEGFEDDIFQENLSPYLDIIVDQCPAPGDTIFVSNSDNVITVTNSAVNTDASHGFTWGCADLETAQRNLWTDINNNAGYRTWQTSGGPVRHVASQIPGGVRFQSLTTNPPVVTLTGSNWAYTRTGNGAALAPAPIDDYFLSRGYMPQTEDERLLGRYVPKNFKGLSLNFSSWDPMLTLKTKTDGENEFKTVRYLLRKDRRKSYLYGLSAHDTMNNNQDHSQAYRQDYSVLVAEPDQLELGSEGVDPEILQEATEGAKLRTSGKWLQVEVSGFQGRTEITSIEIKATTGPRRAGASA